MALLAHVEFCRTGDSVRSSQCASPPKPAFKTAFVETKECLMHDLMHYSHFWRMLTSAQMTTGRSLWVAASLPSYAQTVMQRRVFYQAFVVEDCKCITALLPRILCSARSGERPLLWSTLVAAHAAIIPYKNLVAAKGVWCISWPAGMLTLHG
jgi:hypothetical protein